MQAAYYLFISKDWEPSRFFSMGYGERLIVRSFIQQEIDDEKKHEKEIERSMK